MLRTGLKISTTAFVTVAVMVLSWGFGRWWLTGGHSGLRVGWVAGVLLVGMAVVVVVAGSRMWRMRRGRTHVEPVVAARLLGLAQASALTGAITGGFYLGQALALLPDHDFGGRGVLALQHGLAALGGLLMAVAGLLVQSWCRIDRDDDEGEDGGAA
ncbi:DUF3180 domain-containing protein [Janibacter alittae]|uniref:DUF3180 domain-containing protein n=1 Tax=Janibacter alittae TaxID=3115209 RepID=A0ABZ2MFH3_9MICO